MNGDGYGNVPSPGSGPGEPPRIWPASRRPPGQEGQEGTTPSGQPVAGQPPTGQPSGHPAVGRPPVGYSQVPPPAAHRVTPPQSHGGAPPTGPLVGRAQTAAYSHMPGSGRASKPGPAQRPDQQSQPATAPIQPTAPPMTTTAAPGPTTGPEAEALPRQEWWERLRDRTSRSRIFLALRRVRAVATWFALLVVLVAVVVSPTVRTALGAWIGCLWLVVCWFVLARAKTVSWALTSGVFATGMPLALLIAMASLWICSAAGVTPSDTAASVVVASVVEEVLKLTPLAALALVAPGRVRRFLVSDWIVLGVAAGAAFETVEEVTRRIALLTDGGSLLDNLLCPEGGVRQVECNGATTYSLSPFSGAAGNVFPYAGHAVVTGLVAGAIGLGIALWRRGHGHRGGYRAALQILAPVVPLWTWWVAVVDHMGRNASDYVMWLQTGGEAPSWPIEVTASITGYGHGRGVILLLMLALAWVIDSRTLWGGGYVSALESGNYGNRWAPWRWRVWAGVPRNAFGRFLADGACLVSVVGVEWRWAWMTLMEAAAFREPRLLLTTPAKLRIAREEAARTELDPAPEQWWRVRLAGLCAVVAGVLVIALVPGFTQSMADSLGEGSAHWLAGLLDALGAAWESLSWEQKLGLMLFAGAMILLSGGTLGLAFEVGMGVATVLGSARGAAAFTRDPQGTVTRYLSTHTPAEIALDLATAALTTVAGGAASAMGGQVARGAYAATREAEYAAWLWRTDRAAWRQYVRNARRLARDETGAASAGMWHPRNGLRPPDLRTPEMGHTDNGPGLWAEGKNHGSARAKAYEEQVTGVTVDRSYYVNGVEFDGYDGTHLLDAKGERYSIFIQSGWAPYEPGGLVETAARQADAARPTNTPIQWYVAEKETYQTLKDLKDLGEFPEEIEIFHHPPNRP